MEVDTTEDLSTGEATWTAPTARDNSGKTVTPSFTTDNEVSGDNFPMGTTTVTYTVTDSSGNSATCSFTVTVNGEPIVSR